MVSEGFDFLDEGRKKRSAYDRKSLGLSVFSVCVAFAVGMLIGHYAIKKNPEPDPISSTSRAPDGIGGTTLPSVGESSLAASSIMTNTQSQSTTSVHQTTRVETTSTHAHVTTSQPPGTSGTQTSLNTPVSSTMTTQSSTSSGTQSSPGTTTASTGDAQTDGVFLANVSAAIIREANPNITDVLLNEINATNIREYLRELVRAPHVAGTKSDYEQAEMLRTFWLDSGLDVAVTTPYDILLSYPNETVPNLVRVLDENETEIFKSEDNEYNLTEEKRPWEFPFPYLGYSGNGVVRGPLVYVNYARQEDFDYLTEQGINVSGCIALARYGMGGRAGKVRLAEEHGAVGVIMYADPGDYIAPWATDYYPDSIWIPPTATSRGSIFMGTGDPLTPGYPSIDSAYRYNETDPEANLPKIPAMPVGWGFAEKLLRNLSGNASPASWRGRLNATYMIGPGFEDNNWRAELSVHTTNLRRRSYNAFGMIRGESEPDRYVLLGNHRDSWVLGAIDPSSGTATMMELSRVLGKLVKEGTWRPRRSIIFCSWGAEEFGLIGSTEWIEENSKTLDFRTIAYINMDIAVTGNYSIRGLGSPPVFTAMYRAAQRVPDPNVTGTKNTSVYDVWLARKPLQSVTRNNTNIPDIRSPGEGSDYGTFMQRAGITCADFRYDQDFVGDRVLFYPLYHTSYETLHAVENLIDPGLKLHATIGKLSGELLRDLADSKLLPFNMSDYVLFLRDYTEAFRKNATEEMERHSLNMSELDGVIDMFEEAAERFHMSLQDINRNNPFEIRRVNDQMMQVERTFLDPAALPGRPQLYRHLVHSGSQFVSFRGPSFPGLQDALYYLRKDPTNAEFIRGLQHHFSVLVFTIQGAANSLKDATDFLRHEDNSTMPLF